MKTLQHKFVEFIPDYVEEGILYISLEYATAVHKCACGCGQEVITPLSPTDWELTFNGKFVSLNPSIGNWGFDCKSHYWITKNEVKHARRWDEDEIDGSRKLEAKEKRDYYCMRKYCHPEDQRY